jgi:hypothetical protein
MKHISWIAGLCLLLFCAGPALAQGNLYLGNVHIMPSLSYQAEYNDNIYLSHSNETEDTIHTVTPGLQMEYRKGEERYLRAGYELDVVRYSDESDNDYEEHRADLQARYATPAGWYFGIEDHFVDTEDPYSTANNYQLGTPQVKRWTNTGRATLGYRFAERLEAHVAYVNYLKKYDAFRDQWRDRGDHIYEGRIMYRFWPKTSLFGLYRVQDINYPNQESTSDNDLGIDSDTSQDNLYHQAFLGVYFSPAAKINGEFKIGAGKKDYENSKNWYGNTYEDDWKLNAEADLEYLFSEKTRFDLNLLRAQYESVEPESTSYTQNRIRLGAEQEVLQRVTLRGEAGYTLWDYETASGEPSRDDDTYSAGAGISYKLLDWLKTGVEYDYEGRFTSNSAYRDEEYVDNRVMWTLTAHY